MQEVGTPDASYVQAGGSRVVPALGTGPSGRSGVILVPGAHDEVSIWEGRLYARLVDFGVGIFLQRVVRRVQRILGCQPPPSLVPPLEVGPASQQRLRFQREPDDSHLLIASVDSGVGGETLLLIQACEQWLGR
jgi:hypothetical protein